MKYHPITSAFLFHFLSLVHAVINKLTNKSSILIIAFRFMFCKKKI